MNLESSFSPKQVAQALQVSESSVKRWCDRGVIRTDRTLGGHRRIPLEHLMEFLESTNRRIVDPSAIGLSDRRQLEDQRQIQRDAIAELSSRADRVGEDPSIANAPFLQSQFERALLAGDEAQCRKVISSWYAIHGNMASVADDLMAPTFRVIGQMWECGRADVYQERRGCEICIRLIHELRRLISDPFNEAPLAMGGTSEGDNYQVANQLIEIIFREAGWRTISLGSGVPFTSMASAIQKYRPKVFWLSVSHIDSDDDFLDRFQRFSEELPQGTMLVVGGRCLSDSLRKKMQFSAYCDSMRQLSNLARTLIA
ncbi:MAG: helix-turn-helix domain-containing protein [Pirellula sp.]|nr:helix-turn-helix domain-containing protein [Planctomycetota bacterium]